MTKLDRSPEHKFEYRIEGVGRPCRLLVVLHGYGATQHDLAALQPHVDPDGNYLLVSPRGPIETANGGASWYDFDQSWQVYPDSFNHTLHSLDIFVNTLCEDTGLERGQAVFGGFSQGAGLAAWLSFSTKSPVPAGFWCNGTIIDVDGVSLDLTKARNSKALILASRQDQHVPLERSRSQTRRFREAGSDVTVSEHDGNHGFSQAMLGDMRQWLASFG